MPFGEVTARASKWRWACVFCLFVFAPAILDAQNTQTTQTPPTAGTSAAQVQQQINASGLRDLLKKRLDSSRLTAAQIRRQLATMGYDPATLDPYLEDKPAGRTDPEPTPSTLSAVQALGFAEPDATPVMAEDKRPEPSEPTAEEKRQNLRVYGLDVFARSTSEFDPIISGALPSSYTLGPGDEVVLVITGDVELIHTLPVTREGFVVVPQVGQISVNGLTLGGLRQQLGARLGRVYSGIGQGTTKFDISLTRTRTNQVFVTGDVTRPGSYPASPMASVLNVLYQAGGPTGNGSFRNVQIVRNGTVVQDVDLYKYLLTGNSLSDLRLETGDVVFVPVHETQVAIRGEVARPGIYELKRGETIAELLAFAGGLNAPAHTRRARIHRVLPPEARRDPGIDRVVIDVDLGRAIQQPSTAPGLEPGDLVEVLAVRVEVRQTVTINGSVWRSGSYALRPGMRAWDLISAADGLTADAFTSQAQITRLNRADGSLSTISFPLNKNSGNPADNPELKEDDIVRVFSRADSPELLPITVDGAVRQPYTMAFEKGMTLHEAIIRAGGLKRNADPVVEISRLADPVARAKGGIAEVIRVQLDSTYFVSDEAAKYYLGHPDSLTRLRGKGAADVPLQPQDRVYIRTIPDYEEPRVIILKGEVKYPGNYTLRRKDEHLSEIMERAGGTTNTAYPDGFRLIRNKHTVDVDLPAALKSPTNRNNVILLPGDTLIVPEYNAVVVVQGAVGSPTSVLYRKGADLDYYVWSAGGYARNADKGRTYVKYANGRGETIHRFGVLFRFKPTPEPGSTVTVPYVLPGDKTDVRGLIADVAQIAASLGAVILAITRIN